MKKIVFIFICFFNFGCSVYKSPFVEKIEYSELYEEEERYVKFFLEKEYYKIKLPLEYEVKNFEIISISRNNNNLFVNTRNGGGKYFYESFYTFRKDNKKYFLVDVACSTYIHDIDSSYSYKYALKDTVTLERINFAEYICDR